MPDILSLRQLLPYISPFDDTEEQNDYGSSNVSKVKNKRSAYSIRRRTKSHRKRPLYVVLKKIKIDSDVADDIDDYASLNRLSRRSRRKKYLLRQIHNLNYDLLKQQQQQQASECNAVSIRIKTIYHVYRTITHIYLCRYQISCHLLFRRPDIITSSHHLCRHLCRCRWCGCRLTYGTASASI